MDPHTTPHKTTTPDYDQQTTNQTIYITPHQQQVRQLGPAGAEYERLTNGTRQEAAPRTNSRTEGQTGIGTNSRIEARTAEERTGKEGTGTDVRNRRKRVGETTTGNKGTSEERNSTADRPKVVAGTHRRLGTGTAHKRPTKGEKRLGVQVEEQRRRRQQKRPAPEIRIQVHREVPLG